MVWTQRSLRMSLEHGTEEKNTALAISQPIAWIAAASRLKSGSFSQYFEFYKSTKY